MENKELEKQVHNLELVLGSLKVIHHAMYTEDADINPIDLESTLEMSILHLDQTIDNLYKLEQKKENP